MNCIKLVQLLLVIVSFNNSYSQHWKQYSDSAKAFIGQNKTEKAIEYYYKAKKELQADSMWTVSHGRVCNELGIIYIKRGQVDKAGPLFSESNKIVEKALGREHPIFAASCHNLGNFYTDIGKYEKAEILYLDSKQIREKLFGKEHPDYALSCNNLGVLYKKMAQFEKAEPLLLEAKLIREKLFGNEHPDYAYSCDNLASLYRVMAQYEKAESFYLSAIQIFGKVFGKLNQDYAISTHNLGILYSLMSQYQKAETLFLEGKQIREKLFGKEHPAYASSCNNLGNFYRGRALYEKAEPLFLEGKQIIERILGADHPDYAFACNNLGNLYEDMGQFEKAELLYLQTKQVFEKTSGKEHPVYASWCESLGSLYIRMRQYEKAEPFIAEAKQIRERVLGTDHPDFASSCFNLAILYASMDEYEKAEPLYLEAKKIWERLIGKEHPEYASTCNSLGSLYARMGQYGKAELFLLEARQLREKLLGKEHPSYAETCDNLALLFWAMGNFEKAQSYFTEEIRLRGDRVEKIFQFTSEEEKQSYLKQGNLNNYAFYSFIYSVHSSYGQGVVYDVALSSRNLILSSSQRLRSAIYNTADTGIKTRYNNWIRSREQISFWRTKPAAEREEHIKILEENVNMLEKDLTRHSAEFRNQQEINELSWKKIQQSLNVTEAAIEFLEFQYGDGKRWTDSVYYIALILRKDKSEPELVPLFEKRELESLLKGGNELIQGGKNFINTLYQASQGKNNDKSNSVYKLIWQPLENKLKGISKVYLAPAGLLYRISFAAIPSSAKEVLSDKYQLVQLNTTASVGKLPVNSLSASDMFMLYGGVKYDADASSLKQASQLYAASNTTSASLPGELLRGDRGSGWKYLPESQHEVNEIERLGRQKKMSLLLFTGVNATEESIKSLNARNSPAVLHVATHGFFFPDPGEDKNDDIKKRFERSGKAFRQSDNPLFRSGLLFAGANNAWKGKPVEGVEDGILTAYEVSNLYLPNTKLVVLSACETGLGDIQGSEGVYGLQRSFKMAGVQNLVMSLWKVPDEATSEFMKLFYQNMFNKLSISDAFYGAQSTMKNKYRDKPYNWAAWVFVR